MSQPPFARFLLTPTGSWGGAAIPTNSLHKVPQTDDLPLFPHVKNFYPSFPSRVAVRALDVHDCLDPQTQDLNASPSDARLAPYHSSTSQRMLIQFVRAITSLLDL